MRRTGARRSPTSACSTRSTAIPRRGWSAVVHAETSTGASTRSRELAEAMRRLRRAADGRLRDLLRRRAARDRRVGGRLRVLVHAEVPRRAARDVARRGLAARARGASAHAARRYRLARPAAARALLGRAAGGLPPHAPILSSTRCTRRCGACSRRVSRSAGRATRRPPLHLQAELEGRGLELLADPATRSRRSPRYACPTGVDGKRVQQRMLPEYGIEIGGGLGPAAPPMWRIGLMGRTPRPRRPTGAGRSN